MSPLANAGPLTGAHAGRVRREQAIPPGSERRPARLSGFAEAGLPNWKKRYDSQAANSAMSGALAKGDGACV